MWMSFLVKSAIALGIFYGFYVLTLRNENRWQGIRLFLLVGLLSSVLVPLLSTWFSHQIAPIQLTLPEIGVGGIAKTGQTGLSGSETTLIGAYVSYFYLLGFGLMLVKLTMGFVLLAMARLNSKKNDCNGITYYQSPHIKTPVSFGWIILLPATLPESEQLRMILLHEQSHARLYHSADLLLANLICAVQWFNPFAWLLRNLLREVHEFQADEQTLKKGTNISEYQNLIFSMSVTGSMQPLVHYFTKSLTLKRMIMMSNVKTMGNRTTRFIWIIPAFLLVVASSFLINSKAQTIGQGDEQPEKVYTVVEVAPTFRGGNLQETFLSYVQSALKYPEAAAKAKQQGKVFVQFTVSKTGQINQTSVAKSSGFELLDKEALRVINESPDWTPGMVQGNPVEVQYTIPVNFALQ